MNNFIYYKDEPNNNPKSKLGVTDNRIVEIKNFVNAEDSLNIINYFESKAALWGDIAFYNSSGMGIDHNDPELKDFNLSNKTFPELTARFKDAVSTIFERDVSSNTAHAQKWVVGGFANPHSDNSDHNGDPNAFEINKYVAILYLNDDYSGGEIYFPEHNIEFKPSAGSLVTFPGGVENIHGVRTITEGTRYTMVSFWDFSEIEYSEEKRLMWENEINRVRLEQAAQRENWSNGVDIEQ